MWWVTYGLGCLYPVMKGPGLQSQLSQFQLPVEAPPQRWGSSSWHTAVQLKYAPGFSLAQTWLFTMEDESKKHLFSQTGFTAWGLQEDKGRQTGRVQPVRRARVWLTAGVISEQHQSTKPHFCTCGSRGSWEPGLLPSRFACCPHKPSHSSL